MAKKKEKEEDFAYWRLRTNSYKLLALASLFRNQKPDDSPDDNEEVAYGLYLIVQEIQEDVLAVANASEAHQLKISRR